MNLTIVEFKERMAMEICKEYNDMNLTIVEFKVILLTGVAVILI